MSPAASLVGEAALCDRVEPGEHRRWTPLAGQRCSCICEDFLSEVLGPMTVASLSAEVAVDLRMVSPEGQFGEAFHLLPLSLRGEEGNGLRRRRLHRPWMKYPLGGVA